MKITHNDLASFIPSLHQPGEKTLLHIGCGTAGPERLPECFKSSIWREVRLDINPNVKPDIVASLTDMSAVEDASVDAVWSSHNLEHLEGFEVPGALAEIRRVLKPCGFALITLPNLQRIAQLIAEGRGEEVIYTSPAGPITPLDMLFGHQASLARGNRYMGHRTGFTAERLGNKLTEAGFEEVRVLKGRSFDLWAVAVVPAASATTSQMHRQPYSQADRPQ
nr:class I SAM-dependent methyltransferase [Pseudomonas luteola]